MTSNSWGRQARLSMLILGLLGSACAPQRTPIPIPSSTPSPPPPEATITTPPATATEELATPLGMATPEAVISLSEEFTLRPGVTAALAGTDIEVALLEAHGPDSGCADCPTSARLLVASSTDRLELTYSISGNMSMEALEKARRKTAFGYVFVAAAIDEGSFTLRVEPE